MLKDNAIKYAIIGHSERREYHHEKNDDIKLKLLKAINSNINPILCVGESIEQRESDQTFDVIDNQIRSVLDNDMLSTEVSILIAYEPIWAIGTGLTATPEMANEVHGFIQSIISDISSSRMVPILYGGSMKGSNAKELLMMEHIHGGLIGGASLDASEFINIYNIAEEIRNG
jgi:triosephosphate isomerase